MVSCCHIIINLGQKWEPTYDDDNNNKYSSLDAVERHICKAMKNFARKKKIFFQVFVFFVLVCHNASYQCMGCWHPSLMSFQQWSSHRRRMITMMMIVTKNEDENFFVIIKVLMSFFFFFTFFSLDKVFLYVKAKGISFRLPFVR